MSSIYSELPFLCILIHAIIFERSQANVSSLSIYILIFSLCAVSVLSDLYLMAMQYYLVSFVLDKNSKKYQLGVRLTNYEFSSNLLDTTSRQHQSLKTKLEDSVRNYLLNFINSFMFTKF